MSEQQDPVRDIIHQVTSKCVPLVDAAQLLRRASPTEQDRIIEMMLDSAEAVVALLKSYRRQGDGRH